MTSQELEEKLRSFSKEKLEKFNSDFGGGPKSVEERVREFVDDPKHERRICQLLGLKTEAEKLTDAAIISSTSTAKSARSARVSMIFAAIAGLAALVTLFFNIFSTFHQYDDLKATILSASPSFGTLCTADIIFTNNGNRQCAVAVVNLEEAHTDKIDATQHSTAELTIPFSNQPSFTLKSNDVISKQFSISGKGKITESGFTSTKKGEQLEWRLVFCVVDSNGKYHIVKVPIFWLTVGEDDIKVTKYPLVVKLLPTPFVEEASLPLPLIRPPDR